MAGNQVTLTIGGDADGLRRAAAQAEAATQGVSDAVSQSSREMSDAADSSTDLGSKMGHLGSAVSGATDAIDSVGGSLQALADVQQMSANKAAKQARAIADVEQAQLDLNQAFLDSKQATVDAEQAAVDITQAQLDAVVAQKDYNTAVKESGAGSDEAAQAAIDLKQAQVDLNQANLDGEQATADVAQATRDGKDAQLDLNDAMTAAHPPELQKWADNLGLITPLLSAVVGVMGLVTAAQWLWNASIWANPVTWIIIGIVALIAVIVLIATKTTWFQDLWNWAWGGIKAAASAVWDWISGTLWPGIQAVWNGIVTGVVWVKDKFVEAWGGIKSYASNVWDYFTGLPGKLKTIFDKVTDFISAPFKAGFNAVSRAWNNTIGKLSWTIPDWVPGIGGNSISAPKLPTFHTGGIVPGTVGSEVLAVLQAGEQVIPAAQVGRSPAAGQTVNVGRLVEFSGPVTVRSDQDIVDLSRGIARETTRRLRALGQQVAVT